MTPALSSSAGSVADAPAKKFRIDSRYVAPILISCILLTAHFCFGVLESPSKTLLAIVTSIVTEILLSKITTGRFPHLASAYVSGISIGILVRSPEFWPYALCASIAITSKYLLRWKGRHLWNPSNFAIAVMLLIAGDTVSTLSIQWDNRVWAMAIIWALGSYIIYNLRRFHICAVYVTSFVAFAALRALMSGGASGFSGHFWNEVAPITGPMYQLFIFFMITDPKTTVGSKKWQCIVVFFVAFVEHILRLNQNIHAPYYALFTVGPIANVLDIWWKERKKQGIDEKQASGFSSVA